jgi:hypothetical protein
MFTVHTEPFVDLLRGGVAVIDVEADATNIRVTLREFL